MVAVEGLEPDIVELVVALPHQPLAPVVVLPNPLLEPVLDLLLLLTRTLGRFWIHDEFVRLGFFVVNGRRSEIQSVLNQVETAGAVSSPFGGVRDSAFGEIVAGNNPCADGVRVADLD